LIEGIAAARVFNGRSGRLPVVVRHDAGPPAARSDAGGFFRRDWYRNLHLEISMNDFGLEESYGRFMKDKLYAAAAPQSGGALVDIYV